jgi:hypothetical protein
MRFCSLATELFDVLRRQELEIDSVAKTSSQLHSAAQRNPLATATRL